MSAAAVVRVDLTALRHNLSRVRTAAPGSRVMAVVKGNGYGHGIVEVAGALKDADGLAVARMDEALLLREAGIDKPLLHLAGFQDAAELQQLAELGCASTLHSEHQLDLLTSGDLEVPFTVWIKLDTGMHRLGFPPASLPELCRRLRAVPLVNIACIMSHFACADDRANPFTEQQISAFDAATAGFDLPSSLASSGGLLGWPASQRDWVRPGIMLYGVSPFTGRVAADEGLRPVMTLASSLIAINRVAPGERVGYGATWTAPDHRTIGVVAAGYADGYPREIAQGATVLVKGVRAPVVGRVSMDMLTIDLSAHPGAAVGDEVILWGEGLPIEEVAAHSGTIAYTLLCGITPRVQIEYAGQV